MRLKKTAILVIQETKLKEKEEENIMKKNPKITIISNYGNSKAETVFIINNDIMEDTKVDLE